MRKVNEFEKAARKVARELGLEAAVTQAKGRLGHPRLVIHDPATGESRFIPLPRSPGGGYGSGRGYQNMLAGIRRIAKELQHG